MARSRGMEVVIASRSEERLRDASEAMDGTVVHFVLDVRDARSIDACFEQNSPFDHLVVTAVEVRPAPFLTLDLDDAHHVFDVKFWGQLVAAQLGAPCIREGGSITLFSGVAAQRPVRGLSVLAAANGAVEALVRSLAVELSPIRVNAIAPGFIDTHEMPTERRRELAESLPVGRVGQPSDVARAVLSVMENAYLTGIVLTVDGGHRLA